ncbi:MAG TPA: HEAT repeat domain-containing protein [Cyclobacteriaceae bacterium]|nr:HEAT repeat domain-containing protein [Cyclobacteriaceae bacterium]
MNTRVNEILAKYNEGLADPAEVKQIEQWLEAGTISLTDLRNLSDLERALNQATDPVPSMDLDARFAAMLAREKEILPVEKKTISLWPQLAMAASLAVAGFLGGYYLQRPSADVGQLAQQVNEMKEMMMLTLLEKESAAERLRAVSLTSDMVDVSEKVSGALFQTLNSDPNVNVRLAAIEAMRPYTRNNRVREGLIQSIALQDSPLVQVALADLMVTIQAKQSVAELKKIIEDKRTPKDVREKIKKNIEVLI